MPRYKIYIFLLSSISLIYFTDCKREYNPPALQNNLRLLVVDGLLTSAPDSTFITLTRSRNISDSTPPPVESNATLTIESENTAIMPLGEIRPGVYGGLLSMDSTQRHRLVIRTP